MINNNVPTTRFSWKDVSGASTDVLYSPPSDGLRVNFHFVLAERGVPGKIYYGGAAELTKALGSTTFDVASPYFNAATQFAGKDMAAAGACVMRLCDATATTATFGLFLSVTQNAAVTQYRKNAIGGRLVDSSGNYLPRLRADGVTPVTEAGVTLRWTVRALAANESATSLAPVTTVTGGVSTTTYPILAGKMRSPGLYGNRQGFRLYSIGADNASLEQAIGSILYRFIPVELPTSISTTATPIIDTLGASYNDVAFKPNAIYAATNTNYSFTTVLGSRYVDSTSGDTTLPYDVTVYSANVRTIGQAVVAVSPELAGVDPYLIDLIALTDSNGNLYDHVVMNGTASPVVSSSVTNYAAGGSDGDTSWANLDTMVATWLAGSDHGEFGNKMQWPMTHFSDPGFSMATKTLLFNMLDLRDFFKVDVATQDVSLPLNTKAQDISAGQTLLFRAQMHPESEINGVPCARVGIYAHASTLVDGSNYSGIVPFTYNRMIQRRDLDSGSYVKGSSGGQPNSLVTAFRLPNWVADDEASQNLAWSSCINVVRHATRVSIFYPSLRTVYTNDTSLLSDDEVSDRIIYMSKIVRQIWARYVGVRKNAEKLYPLIQTDINNDCSAAFSGDNINVQANVFQTAEDANLGSQVSVNLNVSGDPTLRSMNFNVIVARA